MSFPPSCRTCPACWRTSRACSPRAATTSTRWRSARPKIPNLSRMTFVVVGDDRVLEQVRKQLEKIVTVVRVDDISSQRLRRARPDADQGRSRRRAASGREIRELVEIFRGRIVDVGADEVMIEISGRESKIEAFIDRMRPFGIVELVRTGRIAMVRGSNRQPSRRRAEDAAERAARSAMRRSARQICHARQLTSSHQL